MAIVGKFEADFTQFTAATAEANTALRVFQDTAAQSGTGIKKVEDAARMAQPEISRLHTSVQAFDSVLGSVGIHLGPEVRGLAELANAAGQTASQIGLVATAGLAFGAAMGGWELGRTIARVFDLDNAVQDAWASLLGLSTAAETAGATQDILARASANAKREITDLTEAQKINTLAFEDSQHSMGAYRNAVEQSAASVAGWRHEIDRVKADGNFESLTADINAHILSHKQLSERYGISAEALAFLARTTKTYEDAVKSVDEQILKGWKDEAEAAKILEEVEIKLHKGYLERAKAETEAQQKKATEINKIVVDGALAIRKVQEDAADALAKRTLSSSDYQIREIWRVVSEEERAFKGSEEQRAAYNKIVEDLAHQQADAIIAEARRAEAEALTIVVGHGPDVPAGGAIPGPDLGGGLHPLSGTHGLTGFAEGGPILNDGPIYAHKGEFVVPAGGGGAVVTNVYVTQPLGTPAAIAAAVDAALMKTLRLRKQWPSN
jgi:hypothetical protein